MTHALQRAAVVDLLESGQTVLVPTQELAGDLRRHFDLRQEARQLKVWEPPKLLPWTRWLESLWDTLTLEGLESRVLLNRLQEEFLWADLAPGAGMGTLPEAALRELARQASSGLALAADFLAVERLAKAADSPDARTFASWYKSFETYCQNHGLLSRALLAKGLIAHLHAGRIPAPHSLYMVGFENFAPSHLSLLEALRSRGTTVHLHTLGGSEPPASQNSCVVPGDPQAELRWAAHWLRQHLAQAADVFSPVALVLPDPERERPLLEPLLREFLAPELVPVAQDLSSAPWHFSTGPALASHTVIAHALLLLRWALDELSIDFIGTLLLSPYLAHSDPFEARARFETQVLRKTVLLRPEMTLPAFLKFAASVSVKAQDPGARLALTEWRGLRAALEKTVHGAATYGEWTERIRKLLDAAGWPGDRALSPAEFRLTEAWESALDLLATLDLHGKRVTLPDILTLLVAEVQSISQHDQNSGAVLQILRPSETEGRLFHAALVLRATDNAWPPLETAHPLLSWALQKSLGMPGTSASHGHQRSLELLRGLADRCSTLVLATAEHDASGPLRLTELAAELGFRSLPPNPLRPHVDLLHPAPPAPLIPELVFDSPLPPLLSPRIAGGARVLELQANCGFRAFASLRLNASVPETRRLGGDARDSGQDLHKALEIFWQRITSQDALRALTPAQRRATVSEAVAAALGMRKRSQPPGDLWTEAYVDVAQRRLTHLLGQWLELELGRENFTVMQQEEKQLISVGPLELSIRPDRIDEVNGGLIFVDYKTSKTLSSEDWLGDRPLAPQLPLYALLAEPEEVRGLAFGRVRAGTDMGWISLQSERGLFPKKGSTTSGDFTEQVALWQTELARLAEAFACGVVDIDPKSYPKTCQFCQQRLLCRLDPATLLTTEHNADELEEEQEVGPAR